MASTATYNCARCSQLFVARTADRKRGWARFCSKSCKAIRQEQRTGQYAQFRESGGERITQEERDHRTAMDDAEAGWDGHKDVI